MRIASQVYLGFGVASLVCGVLVIAVYHYAVFTMYPLSVSNCIASNTAVLPLGAVFPVSLITVLFIVAGVANDRAIKIESTRVSEKPPLLKFASVRADISNTDGNIIDVRLVKFARFSSDITFTFDSKTSLSRLAKFE